MWLVPYLTPWRHVSHRHQRWAGGCRGNRGTATSIWHLGKHSQCGEQDGQHWSSGKNTGMKCYFPKSNLPEAVIIAISHISKTLKNLTNQKCPLSPGVTPWGQSHHRRWFAFAIVSQPDLSHLRTPWRLIFEMPCDDLISAQPQMHHTQCCYF